MTFAFRKHHGLTAFAGCLLGLSAVLVIFWSPAEAAGPTVTVQAGVVDAGQSVSIPIILSDAPPAFPDMM